MKIKINKKEYSAKENETVLDVCRREGIRIPTLCSHGKLKREAVCRMCLVETNKSDKLVTSCTTKVFEGLEVTTESEKIKKAREINLELLWSDHAGKCVKCKKNRQCELQTLAQEYKIENFHFVPRRGEMTSGEENELLRENWSRVVVDEKNPVIVRDSQYCVECRRCINICPISSYGFNHRAGDVVVGTPYNETLDCLFCGACVAHCPTGALVDQGDIQKVMADLDDINILSVAIVDPAILSSVENELENVSTLEDLTGFLRALGCEKIFDLSWGFQNYVGKVVEEIHPHHAKKGIKKMHLSNFCPSAEIYIEKYYPALTKNILKTKRPEELMSEAIKGEYATSEKIDPKKIRVILLSSCTSRKKLQGKNIDHITTVRELGRIVREKKMEKDEIKSSKVDKFLDGAGKQYENLYEYGQLSRVVSSQIKGKFSVGSANGVVEIGNALKAEFAKEKHYDFLEIMICPEGCENGGGQSIKIKE